MAAYLGLLASALLSATILPGSSEVVLLAMLAQGFDPITLVVIATAGNLAGSVLNWWLGRVALRFQDRRWFPVGRDKLARVQEWFKRWGYPALLLSWVPGIGDAFTVAAGVLRVPLLAFVLLVGLAKGARYGVLVIAAEGVGFAGWFGA